MGSSPKNNSRSILDHSFVKVSALLLTYNQERFIGAAIEGALMQKTDFPCEVVVADDCSTDGTRDVIRRYYQRYPDRIRVLLNRHNIGARRTFSRAYWACRGPYVAFADGDDYWTSPDKLQRQADLLDRHPEYALCFHSVLMIWEDGGREPMLYRPFPIRETYTLRDLADHNFIGACSVMYRRGVFREYPAWHYTMPVGDWSQHILHARHGAIGYLDEPMGVYRQHSGGVYSAKPATYRLRIAVDMLRRFRCATACDAQDVLDAALYRSYGALIHQYCAEGRLAEARRCVVQWLGDIRLGGRVPLRGLLKAAARVWIPGPYRRCKQAWNAMIR
jgi:glycosyltransferase involved in cell wall biosynthesis